MTALSSAKRRSNKGQQFVEAIVAAFVLVPLALALLDVIVVVIANQMNDNAAKTAARAAANQDAPNAQSAALNALSTVKTSEIFKSIHLDQCNYATDNSTVRVQTTIVVKLPVPFPGYSEMKFVAADVEPIVFEPTPPP